MVDLLLSEPVPGLPTRCLQVCDPARPHTLVPMPAPRFRFEFMLLPGESEEEIRRADVIDRLMASWIDPALAEVERSAVYTFHGLVASTWRDRAGAAGRRRRPPDAALPRPGDVRGVAGRGQPGLEARRGGATARPPTHCSTPISQSVSPMPRS